MKISSERLAYWFLRLNGFMTIYNFVVHPEEADEHGHYHQRTDVDVMGVRFPYRQENRKRPMVDHDDFRDDHRIQLVLAETKSNACALNKTWRESSRQNMEMALSAAGVLPPARIAEVAEELYRKGTWSDEQLWVRWAFFGAKSNATLRKEFPSVPQFTWDREVLPFVFNRFNAYRYEKRAHAQWDMDAHGMFSEALAANGDLNLFIRKVNVVEPA
ncbi:MAG: hypothetical protein Q7K57_34925 [Burkholderiaceae bacterium]|nr:hypothetical protein [Burkholderiaceae bacterium]